MSTELSFIDIYQEPVFEHLTTAGMNIQGIKENKCQLTRFPPSGRCSWGTRANCSRHNTGDMTDAFQLNIRKIKHTHFSRRFNRTAWIISLLALESHSFSFSRSDLTEPLKRLLMTGSAPRARMNDHHQLIIFQFISISRLSTCHHPSPTCHLQLRKKEQFLKIGFGGKIRSALRMLRPACTPASDAHPPHIDRQVGAETYTFIRTYKHTHTYAFEKFSLYIQIHLNMKCNTVPASTHRTSARISTSESPTDSVASWE